MQSVKKAVSNSKSMKQRDHNKTDVREEIGELKKIVETLREHHTAMEYRIRN